MERLRLPNSTYEKPLKQRRDADPNCKNPYWGAYQGHRASAEQRGIEFRLTFEEWLTIWQESGHLHERGQHKGQYCMARFGDKGIYEVGNVRICTVEENHKERWDKPGARDTIIPKMKASLTIRMSSPEAREKARQSSTGRTHTPANKVKMVEAWKRRRETPVSDETKEKMREAHTGRVHSPENLDKRSKSMKEYWRKRKEKEAEEKVE